MTQQELQKVIEDILTAKHTDGKEPTFETKIGLIRELINQHTLEVIGAEETQPRFVSENKYAISFRNELRAAQRRRAGIK